MWLNYIYFGVTTAGGTVGCPAASSCLGYVVGTQLERTDNTVLSSDADLTLSAGGTFIGSGSNCIVAGTEQCYDLKP